MTATSSRRLAAILVADVVGYSRLMEADESGTLAVLTERRKSILEPVVREHGGRIVKMMGDGVLIELASAVNAVKAALELQRQFAVANDFLPEARRMLLRIGINLGDVIGEGSDIYGDGVNIAARLEALAEPGGICISAKVHDEVRGKIETSFADAGERQLKNMTGSVRVFRAARPELVPARPALALPDKPSIAVLPFQNMSGDPDQEYFADGMVEEIITALSRMKWLFVIARNSSFTYKGRAVDVKQVGRELGVRYVLEGSVRKAADKVRITGQLIDASNGAHLWAERFDGRLEDIFELQDQVTANVVGSIAPKLEQAEIERTKHKPTHSLDAYDYYLRGMADVHRWTREANMEALAHFNRAVDLDPMFSSAYGMAARCYSQRKASLWTLGSAEEIADAEKLSRRAVATGSGDAVALSAAGIALSYVVGELDEGDALIDQALALNPNLAWAWLFSGWVKVWRGEPEDALERLTRAMRLSPQDFQLFNMQTATAGAHFIAGRHDVAFTWAMAALRGRPDYLFPNLMAAISGALGGRLAEAQKAMTRLRQLQPDLSISKLRGWFPVRRPEHIEMWEDGLRKAGLPE